MKIKDGYTLKKVMGSYMIVYLGNGDATVDSMRTLNETGAFLWNLLLTGSTKENLCDSLIKEYAVDKETAAADIELFLSKLRDADLIEE